MTDELKPCPVCGTTGTYEHHADGWVTCSACGIEANREAAEVLEGRAERTCHWIGIEEWKNPVECSECGVLVVAHVALDSNYCPNCGARVMSEEEQGHTVADAIRRLERAVEP